MEPSLHPTPGPPNSAEHFAAALHRQRQRVREFLAAQQERLQRAESQLAAGLKVLADDLARDRAETAQSRHQVAQRSEQLDQQTQALECRRQELDARRAEWEQLGQRSAQQHEALLAQMRRHEEELEQRRLELRAQHEELAAAAAALRGEQQTFDAARREHAAQAEQLAAGQARLQSQEGQLQQQAEQLAAQQAETEGQRRQIAERGEQLDQQAQALECLRRELDARRAEWEQLGQRSAQQHEALLAQVRRQEEDLDQRRTELLRQREELAAATAALQREQQAFDAARREHAAQVEQLAAWQTRLQSQEGQLQSQAEQLAARQAETEGQRRQIASKVKARRAAQRRETERLRTQVPQEVAAEQAEARRELDAAGNRAAESAREAEILRDQCARLEQELAQVRESARQIPAAPPAAAEPAAVEDYRRRYEMALDDLRELKARNSELQSQLAGAQATGPRAMVPAGAAMDWEAEKRRILAAWEADSAAADEPAQEKRLELEELVRKTDVLLAGKDKEITELKQVLDQQSVNVGTLAVGATALGALLDQDAVIREHRENLERLQQEWSQKLRQAEIEISIERAKIARQRAELEERVRMLETRPPPTSGQGEPPGKPEQPARGRWLARLGLKTAGEPPDPPPKTPRR